MLAKQELYHLNHICRHFALVIFKIGSETPGYPGTLILSNSVSQVARITSVSHWHLVHL
jgi:hypothetical protein